MLHSEKGLRIRLLRTAFSLYFGILSFASLTMPLRQPSLSGPVASPIDVSCGLVFAVASWFALRGRSSEVVPGRRWLLVASLLSLLMFASAALAIGYANGILSFWAWEAWFWFPQAIGVVGLIVFSRKPGRPMSEPGPGAS